MFYITEYAEYASIQSQIKKVISFQKQNMDNCKFGSDDRIIRNMTVISI